MVVRWSALLAPLDENAGKLMFILGCDALRRYKLLTYSPMITFPELPVLLVNDSGMVFLNPSVQLTA